MATIDYHVKRLIGDFVDMDIIFAIAYIEGASPVAVSLRRDLPKAGSAEANRILGLDEKGPDDQR